MNTQKHTNIHIHTHAQIHKYTHIHTHTHTKWTFQTVVLVTCVFFFSKCKPAKQDPNVAQMPNTPDINKKNKETKQRGGNAVYPQNQKNEFVKLCFWPRCARVGPSAVLYRHIKNTTQNKQKNKQQKTKQKTQNKTNKKQQQNEKTTQNKNNKKCLMMGLHAGEGENA